MKFWVIRCSQGPRSSYVPEEKVLVVGFEAVEVQLRDIAKGHVIDALSEPLDVLFARFTILEAPFGPIEVLALDSCENLLNGGRIVGVGTRIQHWDLKLCKLVH